MVKGDGTAGMPEAYRTVENGSVFSDRDHPEDNVSELVSEGKVDI